MLSISSMTALITVDFGSIVAVQIRWEDTAGVGNIS
jgi:hypothetical protein